MIHASKWKPAPFYVLDLEREVRERGGIVPDAWHWDAENQIRIWHLEQMLIEMKGDRAAP